MTSDYNWLSETLDLSCALAVCSLLHTIGVNPGVAHTFYVHDHFEHSRPEEAAGNGVEGICVTPGCPAVGAS
jgi:hypothetical protein